MKSFIAAALAAFFILAGAVSYAFYVNNSSKLLSGEVKNIENAIKSSDFENAKNYANTFGEKLKKRQTMLSAIVDHKELYEIKRSLAELYAFLDDKDSAECLAHCGEISSIVNRISENTMPYISNIF